MTNERRVPLDVLVIGAHAHGPAGGTAALLEYLRGCADRRVANVSMDDEEPF